MNESIKLNYPVDYNGEKVEQITMRRPKVQDRLTAEKSGGSDIEKEMRLIANLCEVAPDFILQLDLADYTMVQEKLSDFLS